VRTVNTDGLPKEILLSVICYLLSVVLSPFQAVLAMEEEKESVSIATGYGQTASAYRSEL
jgi:uncharacterized membrane protein